MAGKPSAKDFELVPHFKDCFAQQGGRGMDVELVVSHIRANVPSHASTPEPELRSAVGRLINYWKSKHRASASPARAPGAGAAAGGDSSDEFEEQQQRGEGPALMNVPETNMMNQQLRDAMAKQQQPAAAAPSPAPGSAKKRKAREGGAAQEGGARRRRRRHDRDRGKLRSGAGHSASAGEGAPPGAGEASQFQAAERPTTRLSDMGGVEPCLQAIRELIEWPLSHPEVYGHLGVNAPCGVLLHGPPGCGKTLLAHAIAGELGVPFFKLSATEVVAGTSGESERLIRSLFEQAQAAAPALLFIDEVDAITPKREHAQREMEKRIVAQLLAVSTPAACQRSFSLGCVVTSMALCCRAWTASSRSRSRGSARSWTAPRLKRTTKRTRRSRSCPRM